MTTGDLDDLTTFGARLQAIRERRGLTRVVLAGLVGRSPGWVKKAEKQNVMPDLGMLVQLAKALKLRSVDELVGPMDIPVGIDVHTPHSDAKTIEAAIMSWDVELPANDPVSGTHLWQRAREAMRVWHMHTAPREATAQLIADLIREGRHAARTLEGKQRRVAAAALAETYTLAEHWLSWIGDRGLMMVVADRAMSAAEDADDPHVIAEAAWAWGNVLRYVNADASIRLIDSAARPLRRAMDADTADTEQAAMWGSLQLHQAITHAQDGREGDALRHLDAAETVVPSLPQGWQHPVTVFAPYNVKIHGVSVQAELCKGVEGRRLALQIDPESVPGPYRRSRLWLDAARSWYAEGDNLGAVTALGNACQVSSENMRYSPPAKSLAGALVDDGGVMIAPQARRIAHELGVIA